MRRIIVKMDKDKAVELERVNFELSFTKDVIQRLIESHPNDTELINGEVFQKYNRQGAELQAKYSLLAAEIEREYIPEKLKGHKYTWNIPNGTNDFIIDIQCTCEIEGIE